MTSEVARRQEKRSSPTNDELCALAVVLPGMHLIEPIVFGPYSTTCSPFRVMNRQVQIADRSIDRVTPADSVERFQVP
jgi:hypothetical protein